MVLGLSWLEGNDFQIDTKGRRIYRKDSDGKEVLEALCRERQIPPVEECSWFEEGEVVMILDITERYKDYGALWSSGQANKLPPHIELTTPFPSKIQRPNHPTGLSIRRRGRRRKRSEHI